MTYADHYRTIPMWATVVADTKTPIQLFQLFDNDAAFILESKDPVSAWSNYSFIGLSPTFFLMEREGQFCLEDRSEKKLLTDSTFQEAWESSLNFLNIAPNLPEFPFPGGAVGYFSFESYSHYEKKLTPKKSADSDVHLVFCETILVFNHEREELSVIHLQEVDTRSKKDSYLQGLQRINDIISRLEKGNDIMSPIHSAAPLDEEDIFKGVRSNYTKKSFMEDVEKVKEYIQAGDIFQGVISQRFEVNVQSTGLDLYRVLRKVNPSPYLYYLRLGDQEIIGSSPERLVKIDEKRELEIHPIAGTRARGKTLLEDETLAKELHADQKERAEHLMLVDLARNDIGKVSEFGSVNVHDMMTVTYFSHVMHLISRVTGKLREDIHPFEALFSAHPAGTVSGAPKVRAVEIIQEIEQDRRGVYAGAIAYCGLNGAIDSCIAIRTIILKDGVASVQAGAGIVQDSIPESEYEETRNKAKALLYAIKLGEQRYQMEEVN
ncbi:anthranilate synthase component I [Bacillus tamaricis]|uniref:Anthranilate synthase component 1 n=2 Tax=Evansella tamaricis TaxID=2069301 RepID=A0ABS6JDR0_9BACI|nr:anthranilate synthase component I [Evansella tamaricis]MBU9711820.1 anthranilate synthase component I [Evansella tamaricis]